MRDLEAIGSEARGAGSRALHWNRWSSGPLPHKPLLLPRFGAGVIGQAAIPLTDGSTNPRCRRDRVGTNQTWGIVRFVSIAVVASQALQWLDREIVRWGTSMGWHRELRLGDYEL